MELFDRLQTADEFLNRIQDRLVRVINPIARVLLLDGRWIESVSLTTSFQNLEHKLGRTPRGWLAGSLNADARIWEDSASNNPDATKFLRLRASAAVTCKIWVF